MTELRKCPNPECKVPEGPDFTSAHVRLERLQHGNDEWHARCAFCHARGPLATGKAEAIRLWNALPRQSDLEQLRARIAELDPPWEKLDDWSALPNFEVEVAFEDGTTGSCTDMDCDDSGWFARDSCTGRVISSSGKRLAVTHWRPHVVPKHPESK